ncbi:MAG: hypothetical protein U1F43_09165 [Myxococcota bacterium]
MSQYATMPVAFRAADEHAPERLIVAVDERVREALEAGGRRARGHDLPPLTHALPHREAAAEVGAVAAEHRVDVEERAVEVVRVEALHDLPRVIARHLRQLAARGPLACAGLLPRHRRQPELRLVGEARVGDDVEAEHVAVVLGRERDRRDELLVAGPAVDADVAHVQHRAVRARSAGAGEADDRGLAARAVGLRQELDRLLAVGVVGAVELGRAEHVLEVHGDVEEALLRAAHDDEVELDGRVGVLAAGRRDRAAALRARVAPVAERVPALVGDGVDPQAHGVHGLVRVAGADVADVAAAGVAVAVGAHRRRVAGREALARHAERPHDLTLAVVDLEVVADPADAGQAQGRDVDVELAGRTGGRIGGARSEGRDEEHGETTHQTPAYSS